MHIQRFILLELNDFINWAYGMCSTLDYHGVLSVCIVWLKDSSEGVVNVDTLLSTVFTPLHWHDILWNLKIAFRENLLHNGYHHITTIKYLHKFPYKQPHIQGKLPVY